MSMCAHRQYYYLTDLPRCPKCKAQLTTVLAKYENGTEQEEWECFKCGRFFPLTSFSFKFDQFEEFLHYKFGEKPKSKNTRRKHGRKTRK